MQLLTLLDRVVGSATGPHTPVLHVGCRSSDMLEMLLPRCLCPHDEWEKISGNEYYRMGGMVREYLPTLEQILQEHCQILFLGGPGMGLSSLALQIQSHLTSKPAPKAVLASLRNFEGNLSTVLPQPASVTPDPMATGPACWYLLDDLDQVDPKNLPRLIAELDRLDSGSPNCRVALFTKQGYAATHFAPFDQAFARHYLLGLTSAEIHQACDAEGIDSARFEEELERLDLSVEAGNPAVLRTPINLFRLHGKFLDTRTATFDVILRELTTSSGIVGNARQESLYALGLAMELASRNFLTPAEAEVAIGARLDVSPPEAATLLHEVAPFFLFTADGICFSHHSFGEFFAARALYDRPLSVILDSVFFPGTRIPNSSWKSALGFLMEMHSAVRRYFSLHHPELAFAASLSVLTKDERAAIGRSLYARLRERRESLTHHPEISASRLAQCLPACRLRALEADAKQRTDSILAGNAFLLLGEAGLVTHLALALATALDTNIERSIRNCAFHAVGCLGTAALIPELIARIDRTDPCHDSMLISISRLADEAALPLVMPALLATETYIDSAYQRLRRLQPKPTALCLLESIRQRPGLIDHVHWRFYASCLPPAIRRGWDEDVAAALVEMLIAIEEARVFDLQNDFMKNLTDAVAVCDRKEIVVREVLRRLGNRRQPLTAIPRTLLRLSSAATIGWLLTQNYDERFLASLRMYSRGELDAVFEELSPRPPALEDAELAAWEREHRERLEETEASVMSAQGIVREDADFDRVFNAVIFLGEKRLPAVSPERLEWLATEVDRQFPKVDFSRITWHENSCSMPWLLYCLIVLVHQYDLRLTDDVPLIKSLNSLRGEAAECHASNFGLSTAAQVELESLIVNLNLNPALSRN